MEKFFKIFLQEDELEKESEIDQVPPEIPSETSEDSYFEEEFSEEEWLEEDEE